MRRGFRDICLALGLFLAPCTLFAQSVPPASFTGPFGHIPYDDGGVYVGFQLMYMNTNRPLRNQVIAQRGFMDLTGSLGTQGAFIGSGETALETSQLMGPGLYQPGWDLFVGYRFSSGLAIELGWRHLRQARYSAAASILPPNFKVGGLLENTFLFSRVNNFGNDWAGNDDNVSGGGPGMTYGIWNGATQMQMDFTQRYDVYQLTARYPMTQTDNFRSYALFGPRIAWLWDRFQWTTIDADLNGDSSPDTSARYTNMVSNRLYGVHFGLGNDWYLGTTPIGAFAITFDFEAGVYLDLAKTRASYERLDFGAASTRGRRLNALAVGGDLRLGLWWYPWEAVSVQIGYDVQAYFNTISSPQPVDYNLGTVDPQYEHQFLRHFHGLRFGISFVF
ncbi:MAG: hypothetical protein EXS16_20695 [Gemmataceae bacterium]|nr:hypothetical protein [Gemmataceae bacterium]